MRAVERMRVNRMRGGVLASMVAVALCAGALSVTVSGGALAADGQSGNQSGNQFGNQSGKGPSNTWDWGGEKEVAGSGKTEVSIDKQLKPGQIIVSFQDRRLYLVTGVGQALSYPIAIPRQQDDWQGAMIVSDKKVNPSWTPTPHMIKENPKLPSWVPGGHPYNPLGVRALYLGSSAYRIHGTDAPWTIGEPVSKGCIRMYNKDVIDLYDRVPVGTKVTVNWQSYASKVAQAKN